MAFSTTCPLKDLKYEPTLEKALIYHGNYLLEGVVALKFHCGEFTIYDPYGWLLHATPLNDAISEIRSRIEEMDTNYPCVWGLVFVDDDGVFLQDSAKSIEGLLHRKMQATITTKNIDLSKGLHIVRVEERTAEEYSNRWVRDAQCRLTKCIDSHGEVFYK